MCNVQFSDGNAEMFSTPITINVLNYSTIWDYSLIFHILLLNTLRFQQGMDKMMEEMMSQMKTMFNKEMMKPPIVDITQRVCEMFFIKITRGLQT